MTEPLYEYLCSKSVREDEVLMSLREETGKMAEGMMQISPVQGQFMAFLVKLIGATRILEIGTFTGYSSICLARALEKGGRLTTCDIHAGWTAMARKYWEKAGVEDTIDLRLGPALETLKSLTGSSFDFIFIDADKENYPAYYETCLPLLDSRGVMIFDNVLWGGSVLDPDSRDRSTRGIRLLNDRLCEDQDVMISMLPISDGITLVMKK